MLIVLTTVLAGVIVTTSLIGVSSVFTLAR